MKIWQKTISVIATFALLVNSLVAPLTVLAQEMDSTPLTTSPTPEATTQPTDNPTPTDTATPTDPATPTPEATDLTPSTDSGLSSLTASPTAQPTATPDASPTEIASPTPDSTSLTASPTAQPTDQPTETQAPESNSTVAGPPASVEPSAEPSASPSVTPTATPTVVITNVLPETLQENPWVKLITDKLGYAPTEIEQVCLTDETPILDSTDTDWNRNDTTGISETKNKVELGVRYIFPLENKVSVLFKCLPKDESLRTSLKIQQVKVADLKLPADVKTDSEYAYDITTGMTDGTFEYNITLPKSENSTAEVSYIDKSIEEAKTINVKADEVKKIDDAKLNQETGKVTASGIDHFTIFIATYADLGLVTSELAYLQGDTVYTSSTSLDSTKYYRVDIIEQNGITPHPAAACITGVTSLSGSYLLSTSAPVGSNWKAEITKYNSSSDCTNLSSKTDTGTASFEVKATSPTPLTNPTIPQTCGLDIALVIDNSNSISTSELNQMKAAFNSFVSALTGTPTQFSVTKFGSSASVIQGFTSNMGDVTSAINSIPQGEGGTNWKEGIALARGTFDPRTTKANLMIFASDGNPTYPYCGGAMTCAADVNAAVTEANTTKQFPIRILALGIGEVVLDAGDGLRVENLKAISGHIVNGSTIMGSDVVTTNFSTMATDLATFASQSCGGTITINKYIDTPGNLATDVWSFTTNVPNHATVQTNAGQVNIPNVPTAGSYTITEQTVNSGYSFGSASCRNTQTLVSVGAPDNPNKRVTGITLGDDDIISCDFINTTNYVPACGNSIVDPGEQCDVGNQNGVACTPAYGQSCNYCNSSCQTVTVPGPYCGDGHVDTVEQCDDDNNTSGDGCSATCQIETTTLTLVKSVINNNGGTKSGSDWVLYADGSDRAFYNWGPVVGPNQVMAGVEYTLTETDRPGYSASPWVCTGGGTQTGNKITLAPNENVTCTITNDDIAPSLHLRKIVNNDNGNIFPATAWTLYATDGPTPLSGTTPVDSDGTFSAGTYTLSEIGPSGYTTSSWVCVGGGSQSGGHGMTFAIGIGESATCTITNDDMAPRLHLRKVVINDNGGTATVNNFTLTAGGAGSNDLSGTSPVDSDATLQAGTFTLSESGPAGYTASPWVCSGGTQVGNQITIQNNEEANCTITNDDIQPKLTVTKVVVGSSKPVSQFTLKVDSTTVLSGVQNGFNAGAHTVSEYDPTGGNYPDYNKVISGDCASNGSITLAPGDVKACTITNTKKTGTLRVLKNVDLNGDGDYSDAGETGATNWQWQTSWLGVPEYAHSGSTGDPAISVVIGNHYISETAQPNFHQVSISCTGDTSEFDTPSGHVVGIGENANVVCTFVNARDTGTITIVKNTVGGDGQFSFDSGQLPVPGFGITTSGNTGNQAFNNLTPGSFTVYESTSSGWNLTNLACTDPDGGSTTNLIDKYVSIDLDAGENVTCTFTNTKIPTLTVTKIIDPSNDQGLFNLFIDGNGVATNVGHNFTSNPLRVDIGYNHQVTESAGTGTDLANYTATFGGDCDSTGHIILAAGENKNCTITNTRNTGNIIGTKFDDRNGNGQRDNGDELLAGWTFDLKDPNGAVVQTVVSTVSGFTFTNVPTGGYDVCERPQIGWTQTAPVNNGCWGVTLSANGQLPGSADFGNFHLGEVSGFKYEDQNNNYTYDNGEQYLDNWNIRVYKSNGVGGWITIDSLMTGHTGTTGQYRSTGLWFGTYRVCEVLQPGWIQTYPQGGVGPLAGDEAPICTEFYVTSSGQTYNKDFGNVQLGSITAHKFISDNRDPVQDPGEANKEGWTMSLYNGSGCTGTAIATGTTDVNGNRTFINLPYGEYSVNEEYRPGWENENNLCQNVILDSATEAVSFGNFEYGKIQGRKYEDLNNNGSRDSGEPFLQGWNIRMYIKLSDGSWGSSYVEHTTNVNGLYAFEYLSPGTYFLCEVMQSGWAQSDPSGSEAVANQSVNKNQEGARCRRAIINQSGDNITGKSFGNVRLSNIHGVKWNDENRNGIRDCGPVDDVFRLIGLEGPGISCEPLLSGWTIFIDKNGNNVLDEGEISTQTADSGEHFGWYWFTDLLPGTYSICEVQQDGWNQTSSPMCHTIQLPNGPNTCTCSNQVNSVVADAVCSFGNQESKPEISIEKSNDKPNTSAGDTVNYTLVVTNSGNVAINNVIVTDFLPGGFSYVAGTTEIDGVASSDPGVTGSKLEWSVGTIDVKNSLTITYRVQVANDVSNGTYKNFATCRGGAGGAIFRIAFDQVEDPVNCNEDDSSVTIGSGTSYGGNLTTNINQQVLGASTELPGTGSPTVLLIIALGALGAGLFIRGYNIKIAKKGKHAKK